MYKTRADTIRPKGIWDTAKSASLHAHIEPALREQAETVLTSLGSTAFCAIAMFYQQIVLHNGLPFEVKLPMHALDISRMDISRMDISRITTEQLDEELKKGCADVKAGRMIPVEQAFANVRQEFCV